MFFNSLGRAISVSIAQNIFSNSLPRELVKHAPGVDHTTVINAGATRLRKVVSADQLPGVLEAYSLALDQTFILPIAAAGSALLVSLFVRLSAYIFTIHKLLITLLICLDRAQECQRE